MILANPPFMTPKGGIRPHNRFSIKAKRSEVLFVNYMAEHLNPGGRAGIIVAELDAERKLVEANRELIARMEAKIKAKLAEVWGDEVP